MTKRRLLGAELQRRCDALAQALLREIQEDLSGACQEVIRVEPAGEDVGVGDRRIVTTLAVTDRPRHGTSTAWPDA
jgi:hypothetical protein